MIVFVHLLDHFFFNTSTARYRLRSPAAAAAAVTAASSSGYSATSGGLRVPLSTQARNLIFLLAAGAVVGTFLWFHGVSFGMFGPINSWWGLRWRKSWNIYG